MIAGVRAMPIARFIVTHTRLPVVAVALILQCCVAAAMAQPVAASEVFADARVARLAEAAGAGDAARVRAAIAAGAGVDARGAKGVTPLQWALYRHSVPGMRALLRAGADPSLGADDGKTVLHLAAMADDPRYLRVLLDHRADPDTPDTVTGATALMSALMGERADNLAALLEAGADPDRADRMGNTSLHQAAKLNEFDDVLAFLKAGARADARNAQGASFQRFMFMTPDRLLNARTRGERDAVVAWLRGRGIAIERER